MQDTLLFMEVYHIYDNLFVSKEQFQVACLCSTYSVVLGDLRHGKTHVPLSGP